MSVLSHAHVVYPGEGRLIAGLNMRTKVSQADFDGRLFAFEGRLVPGHIVPLHTHTREDEVTIVLSGELESDLGGTISTLTAGSVAIKPRGIPHSIRNRSDAVTTVLELHTPGQIEPYYDALGKLFASPDNGDGERQRAIGKLQADYGITFHGGPPPAR